MPFNLAHSFDKARGTLWEAPSWLLLMKPDAQALSWMNYPSSASPGLDASWFYERFRFQFDNSELLFLRHAQPWCVQMGHANLYHQHGRVQRKTIDAHLELVIRSRKTSIELGELVFIEIRLRNISGERVLVHSHLDPSDGFTELAITKPNGERVPLVPLIKTRVRVETQFLEPDQRLYHAINITSGGLGFHFKEPGPYRIEACYTNTGGKTAASVMQLWVKPPINFDDWSTLSEFYDARVCQYLQATGSNVMQDVDEKLEWISQRIGERHPVQYHILRSLAMPKARQHKLVLPGETTLTMIEQEPATVVKRLTPLVSNASTVADTVGHIEFKDTVDTYTNAALLEGKKSEAIVAQQQMLSLFRERNVISPVIEMIDQRIKELG